MTFKSLFTSLVSSVVLFSGTVFADAALLGNPVEGTFKTKDKLDLAYVKMEHPNSKGAIVITQGYTEHYVKWYETMNDLYEQGYSIYTYDHRGQGLSPRMGGIDQQLQPNSEVIHVNSWDDYVRDLERFVENVVNKKAHAKKILLGHSMGAAIATSYLMDEEKKGEFNGAVLLSPMYEPLPPPGSGLTIESMLQASDYYCGIGLCSMDALGSRFDPSAPSSTLDGVTHDPARYGEFFMYKAMNPQIVTSTPSFGWIREAIIEGMELQEEGYKIHTPVLMMQAGSEFYVNPVAQDNVCNAMNSDGVPNCSLVKFDMVIYPEGAPFGFDKPAHELYREVDPIRNAVLGLISQFIQ